VTRPSGSTVVGWTFCTPNDGSFNETIENFTCSITFPAPTSQGGDIFNILVRATDAGGGTSTPASATAGTPTAGQGCTWAFRAGSPALATCQWVYDSVAPYISISTIAPTTGQVGTGSTIDLSFPENMRDVDLTTPQSITISDGTDSITLACGQNATCTRTASTATIVGNTVTGTATFRMIPTVNTAVDLPATITGTANFRDIAANLSAVTGDLILP
jgi:hypothetical protein